MPAWARFFGRTASDAGGYALGTAIGPTLLPLTQELQNQTWAIYPNRPIDPYYLAAMVANGVADFDFARAEAAKSGIDAERFDRMVFVQRQTGAFGQAMELWRRGEITEAQVDEVLARDGYVEWLRAPLKTLRRVLASPSDAVRWAVREAFNPAAADALGFTDEFPEAFATYVAQLGIPREDAERHWIAHWRLPSPEQAADMLHRQIITQAEYDQLLKAQDYPAPWRSRLRELTKRIPPLSDLIRFAVRDVYDATVRQRFGLDADYPERFTADAALHGMDETRARQYWAAHWRLPSVTQGFRMLWRGLITQTDLDALLRAQDYPPFWRDRLATMARAIPGRVDLRRLYRFGLLTREQTIQGYMQLGYTAQHAEWLVRLAEAERSDSTGTRDLTLSHWTDEYLGGYITENQYRQRLAAMGYDTAEQDALVQLHSARKVKQARDQAVSRIRARYITYNLTRAEATDLLQRTNIRPEARDRLLAEWDTARLAGTVQMTAAQVRAAFKKGVYSRTDAEAELRERGWREDDLRRFLDAA